MMVLDTNIVILYLKGDVKITEWIDQQRSRGQMFAISTLSIVELLGFAQLGPKEEYVIERWLKTILLVDIDLSVGREAARVRRGYRMTTSDSIMVATAKLLGVPLVTRDKDFKKIRDVKIMLP